MIDNFHKAMYRVHAFSIRAHSSTYLSTRRELNMWEKWVQKCVLTLSVIVTMYDTLQCMDTGVFNLPSRPSRAFIECTLRIDLLSSKNMSFLVIF